LIAGVVVSAAPTHAADAGAEADFVARINSIRRSEGVAPLAVYGELTGIARDWTDHMAANGGVSHNGNYSRQVSADWRKLGENVGMGESVDSVMNSFTSSSVHYRNMVDPAYNYIGVGVSYGADGQLYTTHDFMALNEGGAAAAPPAPRERRPAPPPPDPEPAPEPPPEPAPPASLVTEARMHAMLDALRAAE
jgi:hypothetical protein